MVIDRQFWRRKRVFLTGHTGFKGAWMSMLLRHLGAEVYGFALPPEDADGVFEAARVAADMHHRIGDIRDLAALNGAIAEARPDIVFHQAAQSLVRRSYAEPVETYATNVMGTVNVLEAIRHASKIKAAIIVTSDKCYENFGLQRGYTEDDRFGGHDPYSNSKGCAELVVAAYRNSFFSAPSSCLVASARAGNVVGGGDWAKDRLVPDAIRAFYAGEAVRIRNPDAIRPWQHVLDPLLGYLLLAQRLVTDGGAFAEGWNFGPDSGSERPVRDVVGELAKRWGKNARWELDEGKHPHEAHALRLDCAKAKAKLGWGPVVGFDEALALTVDWYVALRDRGDLRAITSTQIERYSPAA
jgi:CDP-glucose 4,6-dehydratase